MEGPEDSFEALEANLETCQQFCEKYYSDALAHVGGMDSLTSQIRENPNGLLGTVIRHHVHCTMHVPDAPRVARCAWIHGL